ncbi:MAG: Clp protease N-terminal domain-containing protein [Longimicrobiales bacterium]
MLTPQRPYLTTRAHDALSRAHDLADRLGHEQITPTHVVIGVLQEGSNVAVAALYNRGVDLVELENDLKAALPVSAQSREGPSERQWTSIDDALIEMAKIEATELQTEYYGCEHLLLATLRDDGTAPAVALARRGLSHLELKAEILHMYGGPPE